MFSIEQVLESDKLEIFIKLPYQKLYLATLNSLKQKKLLLACLKKYMPTLENIINFISPIVRKIKKKKVTARINLFKIFVKNKFKLPTY